MLRLDQRLHPKTCASKLLFNVSLSGMLPFSLILNIIETVFNLESLIPIIKSHCTIN